MEVGRFGLWKADVVARSTSEVVVYNHMVLCPCSDKPNGTLRFRQEPTSGIDGRLVTVQRLHVVVGEPDPSSFEIGAGMARQVNGQEGSKALRVSDVGGWALGQLEFGSSSTPEADVGIP